MRMMIKKYGQKLSGKEFQFEIPLKSGDDNKMKVQVTNSDDQTAEKWLCSTNKKKQHAVVLIMHVAFIHQKIY